jgi:hypothetical protein
MSLQYNCAVLEIYIKFMLKVFEIYCKLIFQDTLMEKILTMLYNLLQF